jgi:apolipoprotein N-acyltransferase
VFRALPSTDWLLIALAALLLTLAFPPFALVVTPFVCLVPATLLVARGARDADPLRRQLSQGFWYGTIVHAVLMHWLAVALWDYGRGMIVLFPLVAMAFGVLNAAMFAAVGRATATSPRHLAIALPAGVVALEWLTAHLGPLSFPWHQLAITVAATPLLAQTADLMGAEGLSFAIAAVNASIGLAV